MEITDLELTLAKQIVAANHVKTSGEHSLINCDDGCGNGCSGPGYD